MVEFTKIMEQGESIGFVGVMLIWTSFLIGIKFPDWDFKLKIKHRNILTHSPLILWLMIYFFNTQKNVEVFRFSIIGFSLAIGLHMIFDSFPKGWSRGALIYYPWCRFGLGVKWSRGFIYCTSVYAIFLAIKYSENYTEALLLMIGGVYTIVKNRKKEEKFFRPFIFFSVTIVIFSAVKYKGISDFIFYVVHFISQKINFLF